MHQAQVFEITTEDTTRISATLHSHDRKSPHLIIMCPATGAPQRFYQAFAAYASHFKDFDVVTFDYRGTGASIKTPIKLDQSTMSEYGSQDLEAIIKWGHFRYEKICLIGHSVAGQIFPKAPSHSRITAAYFVGSQSAYYGHWKGIWWLYVWLFWKILVPITTYLYGFLPGWTLGSKVEFPESVAREWQRWGTHPQGVLQGDERTIAKFNDVRIPIHFVSIDDDKLLAPSAATQALMHCYRNAVTTFQFIKPKDLKLSRIGHFGFFKRKFQKQLWPMPIFFFTQFVNRLQD